MPRTIYTTVTPLPAGIGRQVVLDTLKNHLWMIDLNPLVEKRELCKPPSGAGAEEYHCQWYEIVDKVAYIPTKVVYHCGFHDLVNGIQTHVIAPIGLDIKEKWTLGGSLPGEPREIGELGIGLPKEGLYIREDVDMSCNILTSSFVKKNLKNAHGVLVERLVEKAHREEVTSYNAALAQQPPQMMSPQPANAYPQARSQSAYPSGGHKAAEYSQGPPQYAAAPLAAPLQHSQQAPPHQPPSGASVQFSAELE